MKKVLILLLSLSVYAMNVNAQDITFGIKAGANFSNLKTTFFGQGLSPDGATSLYIGGLVDIGISENVHIQPELLYSIEGAKNSEISFVNVPLMFKYYLIEGFNIQAGPQLGILVDAEGGTVATDRLKGINFGLNFGAAFEIVGGFFADARYNLGIANIADYDPEFTDSKLRTKGFQLGVGYRF
ncbi:Outer membrane protein beta-barrel domain-containing protein [Muriicola jejuensis]|uniref:Outer membrane beta-barrel protein n=1 Tax=Muriicola jejuensis TaxID=504488 RepID=A0A6P0U997_9FLAO|nr:porin family protein [Muriicola jejuensis]NER09795.1 outer membrane beta-barrel protein [Muriicola jejuensis]SMP05678.1 Outer membrane protein beta-barrel domain-containing protein [Muriicola jejuensis]